MLFYTTVFTAFFPSLCNLLALAICLRASPPLLLTRHFPTRKKSVFYSRYDTLHKGVISLWRTTVPCHRDNKKCYQALILLALLQVVQKYEPKPLEFRKLRWTHPGPHLCQKSVRFQKCREIMDSRWAVWSLLYQSEEKVAPCSMSDITQKLCTTSFLQICGIFGREGRDTQIILSLNSQQPMADPDLLNGFYHCCKRSRMGLILKSLNSSFLY